MGSGTYSVEAHRDPGEWDQALVVLDVLDELRRGADLQQDPGAVLDEGVPVKVEVVEGQCKRKAWEIRDQSLEVLVCCLRVRQVKLDRKAVDAGKDELSMEVICTHGFKIQGSATPLGLDPPGVVLEEWKLALVQEHYHSGSGSPVIGEKSHAGVFWAKHIFAVLQIFQLEVQEGDGKLVEVRLVHLAVLGGTDNSDLKRIHMMQPFSGCRGKTMLQFVGIGWLGVLLQVVL